MSDHTTYTSLELRTSFVHEDAREFAYESDYAALAAELAEARITAKVWENEAERRSRRYEKCAAQLAVTRKGLAAVEYLIDQTVGVAGLHLTRAVAVWESLRTGGQFEEWLVDFDAAIAAEDKP